MCIVGHSDQGASQQNHGWRVLRPVTRQQSTESSWNLKLNKSPHQQKRMLWVMSPLCGGVESRPRTMDPLSCFSTSGVRRPPERRETPLEGVAN